MASVLVDILEVTLTEEHKTGPETENSVGDTGLLSVSEYNIHLYIISEPQPTSDTSQLISDSVKTSHSLLNMDLCEDLDLTLPLLSLPQGSSAFTKARTSVDFVKSAQDSLQNKIQEKISLLSLEQSSYKEEFKLALAGLSNDITIFCNKQMQQLKSRMDEQFNYSRDQNTAT